MLLLPTGFPSVNDADEDSCAALIFNRFDVTDCGVDDGVDSFLFRILVERRTGVWLEVVLEDSDAKLDRIERRGLDKGVSFNIDSSSKWLGSSTFNLFLLDRRGGAEASNRTSFSLTEGSSSRYFDSSEFSVFVIDLVLILLRELCIDERLEME